MRRLATILAVAAVACSSSPGGSGGGGAGGAGGGGGGGVGGGSGAGAGGGGTGGVGAAGGVGGGAGAGGASGSGGSGGGGAGGGGTAGTGGGAPDWTTVPAPFDLGVSYTSDLWVVPGGDDGTADGSPGAPFGTLGAAMAVATPGTRVRLAAGTHAGDYLSDLQGAADAPIALTAEPGAILEGGTLGLSRVRYLVVDGLTIRNTTSHGINLDDGGVLDTPSEWVVLRNLHLQDNGTGGNNDCLKVSGVDHFWVLDSEIEGCNAGEGIDMVGCHDGVIQGNHFHDVLANAVQTKGGSRDVLLYGNRFSDIPQRAVNLGGSTGAAYFRPQGAPYEALRTHVVANVFERVGAGGGTQVAYVNCSECVVANNTFVEPHNYVASLLWENVDLAPSHDGWFIDNLVVFNVADLRSWSFVNVGAGHETSGATFTFGSNLWFALDDPGFTGPPLSGVPPETTSVVQQDPLLANRGASDYHLQAGSAALGVGRAVSGGVPADFDGRPYPEPPDAGAFAGP